MLLGRSWGNLELFLGLKIVRKIEKAPKFAEKVFKSAKQLPLKASWAQLGRSWAWFLALGLKLALQNENLA